jgi:hypothetical protein
VKLKIFEEARQQFREENAWWRENRDIKTLFAQEFLVTIRQIQKVPGAGPVYVERRGRAIRKWLMPKTRCHIYYRVDSEQDLLLIYSVWGARRGRGPRL